MPANVPSHLMGAFSTVRPQDEDTEPLNLGLINGQDPNCPTGRPKPHASLTQAQRNATNIQGAVANQNRAPAQSASANALENAAMWQVSCPPPKIHQERGVCGKSGYRASTYDCGAYVRLALWKAKVVPKGTYFDRYAKNFGCGLRNQGFRNLCGNSCSAKSKTCNMNPYNAPKGSVLVYDNIPGYNCHVAGHVEIRTSKGFVSDYFSPRPRSEATPCRRLIGIWVK